MLGHAGIHRTVLAVTRSYYWTGINKDVRLYISACDSCQRFRLRCPDVPKNTLTLTQPDVLGAFRHIHLDSMGPFPHPVLRVDGQPAMTFVLIMVDYFTKCFEYGVYVNTLTNTAEHTAALTCTLFFEHWISRYIVPDAVTFDNGPEFGQLFQRMCDEYGIEWRQTAVRNPAANGCAESVVKYMKRMLRRLCAGDDKAWLSQMPKCRGSYMRHLSTSTGYAPCTLTYGLQPDLPAPFGHTLASLYSRGLPALEPNSVYHSHVEHLAVTLSADDLAAFNQILASQHRNIRAFENALQSVPQPEILPNDFVLLLTPATTTLQPSWAGPYLYMGLDSISGLAVLQSGTDAILDASGRGSLVWKVKPHLLRKYVFPFQIPRTSAAAANLVAPCLRRG
jgi:hypothetical protein